MRYDPPMSRTELPSTSTAFTTAAGQAAAHPWVRRLGKAGFAAKGVLYLAIAATAGSVGLGGGEASQTGAIEQLGEQSFGTAILVLLAVGLAGYALLRLVHVVVDPSGETGAKGVAMRISYAVRAAVYGGLTWYTVQAIGGSEDGGGQEQELTRSVLELPLGSLLVGGAAAALAVVALFQLKKAAGRDVMDQVHATGRTRTVTTWAGTIGHAARGVLFGTIAVLLARAATQSDAAESGGLSEAFQELAATPAGTSLLTATAIGVAGYGVWCLAMAVWGTAHRAE